MEIWNSVLYTNSQFIHCLVKEADGQEWKFTAIYDSLNEQYRIRMIKMLLLLHRTVCNPWLLVGDFNMVMEVDETTSTCSGTGLRCEKFREWCNSMGLVDLGFSKSKCTWCRGPSSIHFKAARLNRVLAIISWCSLFAQAIVSHLQRENHVPLLINLRQDWMVEIIFVSVFSLHGVNISILKG